jgi:hypothetical protein
MQDFFDYRETKTLVRDDKVKEVYIEDGEYYEVVTDSKGNRFWKQNGDIHRLKGPAVELANGKKEYFLRGVEYSKEKFDMIIQKTKKLEFTDGMLVETITKAETKGKKFDGEKPVMALLPMDALYECARVLTHGRDKYGSFNWKQGMDWSRPLSALLRHLETWMNGEDLDYDSGNMLLAQVAINALFLLSYQLNDIGTDDRWHASERELAILKKVRKQIDEAVEAHENNQPFELKLK